MYWRQWYCVVLLPFATNREHREVLCEQLFHNQTKLGRVLAREWARTGISVNILCPGYIETDLNDEWFASEGGQKQIARWPRKRLLAAEDLDATVLHLLSDAARRVTGGVFTIDDGQSL